MADDIVPIIKVDTGKAVQSIGDLRENIKSLKSQLEGLNIGSEEYKNTLDELKINQNALKDAMYATTASMDDVSKSATGVAESYNGLVHRMAALKEELRNTDVSTKAGAKRFGELAGQIDDVNSKLKAMDELQGNYQRNVGNYQSAFKGLGEKVDGFGKGLKALKGGAEGAKGALDAMGKTPALVVTGLLVSSIASLVAKFKETEQGTQAIQAGMANLKPVMDIIRGVVAKLSEVIGNVVTKVATFLGQDGLIEKIISGVMGVGNAIIQYVTAPFRGVIEAIKVFKEKGVKGLGEAGRAFGDAFKKGVSFKANFESGKETGDKVVAGLKDAAPKAKEAGEKIGKEVKEGVESQLAKVDLGKLGQMDKGIERNAKIKKENEDFLKLQEDFFEKEVEDVDKYLEEISKAKADAYKTDKALDKMKIDDLYTAADTTSSLMSSIADIYEADEKNSTKNAKKIKSLRIASAIIDTISGAVKAMSASAENPIMALANAATITAAGMANVLKIKNTQIGSESENASTATTALASAPSVSTQISQVRSVTTATEETRLNQMASEQRVYILADDIQASQSSIRTRIRQTSF